MNTVEGGSPGNLMGVVLAGGRSRRFGADKALFNLAGRPMAAWALDALKAATALQVVVGNDPRVADALGVPGRPDRLPNRGPLGGLQSGLAWAREEGYGGVFLLACDLPLMSAGLVARILEAWPDDALGVVPESSGPLGFEPLCAGYRVGALPILHELLREGAQPVEAALSRMGAHRIPLARLGSHSELVRAFTNVNTPESAEEAEGLLLQREPASLSPSPGGRPRGPDVPRGEGHP